MFARVLPCAWLIFAACYSPTAVAVEFSESGPFDIDFGVQRDLPAGFGSGEFTLEVRFWADNTYPIGPTRPENTLAQCKNWAEEDHEPYSRSDWWFEGNFLLDGHNNNNFEQGSFSLQFYGGGRLRWLFGDGAPDIRQYCWSVGVYPALQTPSLLDGEWHWVSAVRRWNEAGGADLELWIDGALIATEHTSARTDLWTFWKDWNAFYPEEAGWYWGAEKQAAVRKLRQYEDFKGKLSEIRFWSVALSPETLTQRRREHTVDKSESGLVGLYHLPEQFGGEACNASTGEECIAFNYMDYRWSITRLAHGWASWTLIATYCAAGTAALRRRGTMRSSDHVRAVFMFAALAAFIGAVSTLLDLPTLLEQKNRLAAQSLGLYGARQGVQLAGLFIALGIAGWIAFRGQRLYRTFTSEAKWVIGAAGAAASVVLVRWVSWHRTDTILGTGHGEITIGWAVELGAAAVVFLLALRRPGPRTAEIDQGRGI